MESASQQIITVVYYETDSGNCKTIFKEEGKNRYFSRIDNDGWFVEYTNGGYFESSHLARKDITFKVADKNSNVLFLEGNGAKEKIFRSIRQMAKAKKEEWTERLSLKNYEDWKAYLLRKMPENCNDGSTDNWLFVNTKCINEQYLETFEHLGLKFAILIEEYIHEICGDTWKYITVKNLETSICEGICGYIF